MQSLATPGSTIVSRNSHLNALPHLLVQRRDYPHEAPPDGCLGGPGFGANYVLGGQGIYRDAQGRQFPLRVGSLYFRCGKYPHETHWERKEPVSEYILCFSRLTYEHLEAVGLVSAIAPPVIQLRQHQRAVNGFEGFLRAFAASDKVDIAEQLHQVVDFLRELRQLHLRTDPEHPHAALVEQAQVLIDAKPESRADFGDLAQELGVSYSLLRKAFRQVVGESLGNYRIHKRLQTARLLLDRHCVQEVAEQLGYGDPFAFSRQFKQVVGISPKQFQMLHYRVQE